MHATHHSQHVSTAPVLSQYGLTRVLTAMSEMRVAQRLEVLARQGVTQEMIDNMDRDFSGQIEKLEFVIHVLQDMGRVRGAGLGGSGSPD